MDKIIILLNLLQHNKKDWQRLGNSSIYYQNRVRPQSYSDLAQRIGFQPLVFKKIQLRGKAAMLDRSMLDVTFRDLDRDELLCGHFLFMAEKSYLLDPIV